MKLWIIRWLVGLGVLLISPACSEFIEVVPKNSPIPTPVALRLEPQPTPGAELRVSSFPPVGIPSRIMANTIALDALVVEMGWRETEQWGQVVSEWEVPKDGAAWHRNSARPGDGSNVVISGHNGSAGGQVFENLEQLQVGDQISLWNDQGKLFTYRVETKNIIRTFGASAENLAYLERVMGPTAQEQLTLITCWPNWTNTHRLVVIAKAL